MASLPKHIIEMVNKGNLVNAIKALSDERGISMGDAKDQIDAYESSLQTKRQHNVDTIASKQGMMTDFDTTQTLSESERTRVQNSPSTLRNIGDMVDPPEPNLKLNKDLDSHLDSIGYKKPLMPYWAKRLLIFLVIFVAMSVLFYSVFGRLVG